MEMEEQENKNIFLTLRHGGLTLVTTLDLEVLVTSPESEH